ncbi:hypothetical protein TeGR_g11696 [Tetraparma gracilis]|uniref:Glycosyltransferase subfamily 4-like N-terminal domain-containing protein n=1 Tax=Tetraparma gracilis TaxID=2962635 RepID=A0ABQ6MGK0_9STRA|nr:hypothetical protein TeGR_g11696 [Tetraparma gracilis]
MGKPRLLVVTDSYCPRWDGVARVLVSILPTLAEHFQVRLLCPDYSKHFPEGECPDIPGVTLVFSPLVPLIAWRGCRIPLLQPHVARAEVENADICFTHTLATLGSAVLTFAQALGVPTCSFVHSEEWHVYGAQWRPFGERVVKLMTNKWAEVCQRKYAKSLHLIVPSATTQAALRDYGVAPSRGGDATVVNLGVDAKKFAPLGGREARSARKAELGFPADIPLVMFLGRFSPEKKLDTLVQAVAGLWGEGGEGRLHLAIVGGKREDIPASILEEFPSVFGGQCDGFSLVGQTDVPERYLQAADFFVLPSSTECMNLSVIEAMACGCVPVATRVGAAPRIIRDGGNGYLVDVGDHGALRGVLEGLLGKTEAEIDALRGGARATAESLSWVKTAETITTILKDCMAVELPRPSWLKRLLLVTVPGMLPMLPAIWAMALGDSVQALFKRLRITS